MRIRTLYVAGTVLVLSCALSAWQANQAPAAATQRITKEVRHELLMLPYLGVFDNLAYKVDGYNVTLIGQVTRPTLKSDAENVVKRIEGVEHVDNQIEVLPPSPMDDPPSPPALPGDLRIPGFAEIRVGSSTTDPDYREKRESDPRRRGGQ